MERLSEEVKSFILEKIESVGHLEVLVLLYSNQNRTWTPEMVSNELRSNTSLASAQLESLRRFGVLSISQDNSSYQFVAKGDDGDRIIQQVIDLFRERRMMLINLIYSKPAERVKSLADAFKLRREE